MAFSPSDMKGVIPALITSFDEHENFDPVRMRNVVQFLIEKKVHGLYLTGSTGEGLLMTPEERMLVVETVIDEVAGKIPVIVHIGAIGSKVSCDLARHAKKAGADAISSVPPFYFAFQQEHIVRYYQEVTAAGELPMFLYNISLAGSMNFDLIKKLSNVEGVAGMKFTSTAHHELLRIRQELSPNFVVFSGADEMAMSGLAYGADGLIGSFYNLIPEVFLGLYEAHLENEQQTVQQLQSIANRVIYLSLQYDCIGLIKQMMQWMGADGGYARSPFCKYSVQQMDTIRTRFKELHIPKEYGSFFQAL